MVVLVHLNVIQRNLLGVGKEHCLDVMAHLTLNQRHMSESKRIDALSFYKLGLVFISSFIIIIIIDSFNRRGYLKAEETSARMICWQ